MTNTVKYVLIGAGSIVTTALVSGISYIKGKKDGVVLGMKQAQQLPADGQSARATGHQPHASA